MRKTGTGEHFVAWSILWIAMMGSVVFFIWTTSSMIIASWNVNSIRARLEHVKTWLATHHPDVLLLQELKAAEFPSELFKELGYASAAVTQKTYNGVAILSLYPIEVVSTTLVGDETDSHARFLEVVIDGIRIANIYLPNGNPVASGKFVYKLEWMDRLQRQMQIWLKNEMPTLVGGDFNVIPEDIDCHKPASWMHDALFQPEPRARYRALIELGYVDAFRFLHPGQGGYFTFWDYFRKNFEHNRGIRIDHLLLSTELAQRLESCEIDKGPRGLDKPSDHTPILAQFRSGLATARGKD
jgi:exodeoxyribonuclease III